MFNIGFPLFVKHIFLPFICKKNILQVLGVNGETEFFVTFTYEIGFSGGNFPK